MYISKSFPWLKSHCLRLTASLLAIVTQVPAPTRPQQWDEVVASTQGSEPGESWKLMREEGAPTRTRPGPNHLGVWNVVEMYIDISLSPLLIDADQFYYTGSVLPLYASSSCEVVSRSVVRSNET